MAFEIGLLFDNRYTLIEKIGIGGFSEVWKAKDTFADGLQIALKIYAPDKGMDSQGIHQFKKEYALMLDIRHQNILTASHFSIYKERPYLVLPFCEGGSVHNLIYKKTQLSEPEIAKVLKQVCSGLAYLHQQNIIHQDLKPDNVLIDKNGNYLLTDFGISSRLRSTLRKNTQSSKALTAAYAPPERFSAQQLRHFNGDVFSLGVMIYEMATGDVPWMGMGGSVVRADSELPELPSQYSRSLNRLMHRCLQYNPNDRMKAEELQNEATFFLENDHWPSSSIDIKLKQNDPIKGEVVKDAPLGRKTEVRFERKDETEATANEKRLKREPYFYSITDLVKKRAGIALGLSFWCFTVFLLAILMVAAFSEGGSQDGDDEAIIFSLAYGSAYVATFLLFITQKKVLKIVFVFLTIIPFATINSIDYWFADILQLLLVLSIMIGLGSTLYWLVFWIIWLKAKYSAKKVSES